LGVELNRYGVTILLNSKELCVRIIVSEAGSQPVGKPIFLTNCGQGINEFENLGPSEEVAIFGVVEMATTGANVFLKTFNKMLHGILRIGTNAPRILILGIIRGAETMGALR